VARSGQGSWLPANVKRQGRILPKLWLL